MRIQSIRASLGLSLVLGVLAGVALLSLPALVPPGQQRSDADTGVGLSFLANEAPTPPTRSPPTSPTSDRLGLAFGLFLILVPGSILSLAARKWATRKLEDYWYS